MKLLLTLYDFNNLSATCLYIGLTGNVCLASSIVSLVNDSVMKLLEKCEDMLWRNEFGGRVHYNKVRPRTLPDTILSLALLLIWTAQIKSGSGSWSDQLLISPDGLHCLTDRGIKFELVLYKSKYTTMKKSFLIYFIALSVGLVSAVNSYSQDTTTAKQDVKNASKKTGNAVKKEAQKVGNKTAEIASKGKSAVVDKTYDGKQGPNGEKIFIDGDSKYYFVDKKGHKKYVPESKLKDK